LTASYIFCI